MKMTSLRRRFQVSIAVCSLIISTLGFGVLQHHHHHHQQQQPSLSLSFTRRTTIPSTLTFTLIDTSTCSRSGGSTSSSRSSTRLLSNINGATDDDFEFEPDDAALEELEQVQVVDQEEEEDDENVIMEEQGVIMEEQGLEEFDELIVEELGEDEIVAEFEQVLEEDDEYEEDYESDETYTEQDVQDWDDQDGGDYELQDDDDPNYTKQKELLNLNAIRQQEQVELDNFNPIRFAIEEMDDDEYWQDDSSFFENDTMMQERIKAMSLTQDDLDGITTWDEMNERIDAIPSLAQDPMLFDGEDDEKEMQDLQQSWDSIQQWEGMENPDKVTDMGMQGDLQRTLSNETLDEIEDVLEEIGGSSYNCTKYLLYDLDFNVTNLVLAALQHNPNAPILFQHWYPQLLVMKRYEAVRAMGFDWTWEDVQNADMDELVRYYQGMGYTEIPTKAPAETGIISLEDLDEEEIKMASFERWITDVYNPEWDKKDFDDEELRDEDNVFSKYFEMPDHPDKPSFDDAQDDVRRWNAELEDEGDGIMTADEREYADMVGREIKFNYVKDPEFEELFRGHLVVACSGDDSDLEIAEKITLAMEKNFGKQIFVETRMITHAREEDNVFEVWIESYDVELLHSKKRATTGTKGWTGPADCDDEQIDYLVDRVGFLISDAARYSYKYEFEMEGV